MIKADQWPFPPWDVATHQSHWEFRRRRKRDLYALIHFCRDETDETVSIMQQDPTRCKSTISAAEEKASARTSTQQFPSEDTEVGGCGSGGRIAKSHQKMKSVSICTSTLNFIPEAAFRCATWSLPPYKAAKQTRKVLPRTSYGTPATTNYAGQSRLRHDWLDIGGFEFDIPTWSTTVDGEISQTTIWDVHNPVNNGINYQPQLVIAGFLPSTVGKNRNAINFMTLIWHQEQLRKDMATDPAWAQSTQDLIVETNFCEPRSFKKTMGWCQNNSDYLNSSNIPGLCESWWANEQWITIFPSTTKWRANEQPGGGWAPARYCCVMNVSWKPSEFCGCMVHHCVQSKHTLFPSILEAKVAMVETPKARLIWASVLFDMNWVFPKIGVPHNGWFIVENHIKMDDLGVPLFLKTPICWWDKTLSEPVIVSLSRAMCQWHLDSRYIIIQLNQPWGCRWHDLQRRHSKIVTCKCRL